MITPILPAMGSAGTCSEVPKDREERNHLSESIRPLNTFVFLFYKTKDTSGTR
jgi:hypothetical protein